jgi:hypothetical protein
MALITRRQSQEKTLCSIFLRIETKFRGYTEPSKLGIRLLHPKKIHETKLSTGFFAYAVLIIQMNCAHERAKQVGFDDIPLFSLSKTTESKSSQAKGSQAGSQ